MQHFSKPNSWAMKLKETRRLVRSGREVEKGGRKIKIKLGDITATHWPGFSLFPNSFTHIFRSFKSSHNCFLSLISSMCAPCQKGSAPPGSFPQRSPATQMEAALFGNVIFAVKGKVWGPVGESATSGNVSEFLGCWHFPERLHWAQETFCIPECGEGAGVIHW